MAEAWVQWRGDRMDQQALANQPDWSQLQGIDGLWPRLAHDTEWCYGPIRSGGIQLRNTLQGH